MGYISKPPPGSMVDWTHPLSRGLIGCWLFNERAGSKIRDISPHANDGTLINMTPATDWVGCPYGGALNLRSGSNAYIDLGRSSRLDVTNGLTVFVRLLPTAVMANYSGCIQSAKDSSNESGFIMLGMTGGTAGDAGLFRFYCSKPSSAWAYAQTDSVLKIDRWYNLAGVWDRSNVILYVEGVAQTVVAALGSIFYGTIVTSARIGHYSGGTYFPGMISDVRIFDRSLSVAEMKDLGSPRGLYANIVAPSYRRYFIPAAGGLSIPVARPYTQAVNRAATY